MKQFDFDGQFTKSTIGTGLRIMMPCGSVNRGDHGMWRGHVWRCSEVGWSTNQSRREPISLEHVRAATVEDKLDAVH